MSIPGNANPLLLRTVTAAATGISRSLRFNSADSAYLSRTPASAGNRKTWTWAAWVKRAKLGSGGYIFSSDPNGSNYFVLYWDTSVVVDALSLQEVSGGSQTAFRRSASVYRDPSAWYHIVLVIDTTQGTASNRIKMYVNGSEITAFNSSSDYSQNADTQINTTNQHNIGRMVNFAVPFDGYLADIYFIDGSALDPTSFGEFDATTGVWNPKAFSGSYGTNGFHLEFADNSAATATTLGKDTSGNGNNWTPNNFSVSGSNYTSLLSPSTTDKKLFDGSTSTNFSFTAGQTYSITFPAPIAFTSLEAWSNEGNSNAIRVTVNGTSVTDIGGANWDSLSGTSPLSSLSFTNGPGGSGGVSISAIRINGAPLVDSSDNDNDSLVDVPTNGAQTDTGVGGEVRGNYCTWNPLSKGSDSTLSNGNLDLSAAGSGSSRTWGTVGVSSGKWYFEFTQTSGSYAQAVGIKSTFAADALNNYFYWGYNGNKVNASGTDTSYGASWTNNDVIGVAFDLDGGTITFYKNGTSQGQAFSGITAATYFPYVNGYSGGSWAGTANFGQRQFAYTAPSGFKALCTANLPAPVVTKPNTVFDAVTYNGSSGTKTITMPGSFGPDLVWIKNRGQTRWHNVFDQVRGAYKRLFTNDTSAETNDVGYNLNSFTSTGFTLLDTDRDTNSSAGDAYVAWCWDAGTSTVTNTQGSITSSVRANATAGFSVVGWTSDGSASITSVGHGLNAAPQFIVFKNRDAADNWVVIGHPAFTNLARDYLNLNTTGAKTTNASDLFSAPTSTTFAIKQSTFGSNGNKMIAYCFAPVVGYSSFGSYTGNGSTDGPFVYCGFRPKYVVTKRTDSTGNWRVKDSVRDTYNAVQATFWQNTSGAELTEDPYDFLSNGFKIRTSGPENNASGGTYIYIAFAESPFNYSRAR